MMEVKHIPAVFGSIILSEGVPLSQHWGDIRRFRWLIVLTAVAAAGFAWAISTAITPIYEAKSTFYLATNADPPGFLGPQADRPPAPLFPTPDEKSAALNVGILRGREMMAALSDEFGIPVPDLRKRLDVKVSGEFMVDAFFRDPDPARAAAVAGRVPTLYAAFHEASMRERAEGVASALQTHIAALQAEVAAARSAQEGLRAGFGVPPDDELVARLSAARAAAEDAAAMAVADRAGAEARVRRLEAELAEEGRSYAGGGTIAATAALDAMEARLLALRVDLAGVTDGPLSPRREGIEQQIAEVEAAAGVERARIVASQAKPQGSLYETLRADLLRARADLSAVTATAGAAQARAIASGALLDRALTVLPEASELARAIPALEGQIAGAESNLAAATMQAAHAVAPLITVERPVPPTRPAFPVPILNAVVAALTGAILGCYYALFLGHARRIRLRAEAGEGGMPVFTLAELAALRRPARKGGEVALG